MAADCELVTERVQSYLDKHKISSLFEDLKSKVIKELPADPIEFLISKLQALQRQKKKTTPSRPTTSSGIPSSRTKIQVTGTSVTTAAKAKGPSTGHPVKPKTGPTSTSSPSHTKTTPGARTRSPRPTSGGVKTDTSKHVSPATAGSRIKPSSSPKRPTTAPSPGAAKSAGSQTRLSSPAKASALRSPSKLTTSTSSSGKSTPTRTAARTGLKPPTAGKGGTGTVKSTTQIPASRDRGKTPSKKPDSSPGPKKAPASKTDKTTRNQREASSEEIAEFFGEPKKTSGKLSHDDEDEDTEDSRKPTVGGEESDSESSVTRGRGEDVEAPECAGLDIETLLQMRMSMKQGKKEHSKKKAQCLLHPKSSEDEISTPSSLGYHSGGGEGGEESEEDECVEAVEDAAALEDEGVTGLAGKYAATLSKDARVDFMVLLCARCAKILTGDEPATEVSAIVVTRGVSSDFESASQVGSHASFPQWEVGTEVDSEVSSRNKWKNSTQSHDSASDVTYTLHSQDTWGGLAPPTRQKPSAGTSDEESEIQLPPPPPLEGRPWAEDPSHPHDPHGWGEQS